MVANNSLGVCESVLARVDAVLEVADEEIRHSKAAEMTLRSLLSRVANLETAVSPRETPPISRGERQWAANDNPSEQGVFSPVAFHKSAAQREALAIA
jgi:hypothetical protein